MTFHVPPGFWDLGWSPFFHQQWLSLAQDAQAAELAPARVVAQRRGELVLSDGAERRSAVLAGRLRQGLGDRTPCVGDFVLASATGHPGSARIEHLLERTSLFRRKVPGASSRAQDIAANLDVVFVVCALAPEQAGEHTLRRGVNPRRIERYLHAIREAPAGAVVLLNKADLNAQAVERAAELSDALGGTEVLPVSAQTGAGLDAIFARIPAGTTALLVGSSGAGKSSLTNRLLGSDAQRVQAERTNDGRGRHTTTERLLQRLPGGGSLIDTPGLRELALYSEGERARPGTGFDEIDALAGSCRFRDCRHSTEPGCAVRQAVASGLLDPERVEHARRLERELSRQELRHDVRARAAERKQGKALSRALRVHKRSRGA